MSETPNTYIGTYVDFEEKDSTDPRDYKWARLEGIPGEQGIPGTTVKMEKHRIFISLMLILPDGKTGFSVSDSTNKIYIGHTQILRKQTVRILQNIPGQRFRGRRAPKACRDSKVRKVNREFRARTGLTEDLLFPHKIFLLMQMEIHDPKRRIPI